MGLLAGGALALLGMFALVRLIDARAAEKASAILRNIEETRATSEPLGRREKRAIDAVMIDLVSRREAVDEQMARLEHVRNGGHWDDSPTKWKQEKGVTK